MTERRYFREFVPGRKGEILDAALTLLSDKGYEGATLREVAAQVGVTEPALYRHYSSKEALFEEVITLSGERAMARATALLETIEPDNLRESLKGLIEARRRGSSKKPVLYTLVIGSANNPRLQECLRVHVTRPMRENLAALVPKVDAFLGIHRAPEETAGPIRAFMSLFMGYMQTSVLFEHTDDDAIVDGMLAVMGWNREPASSGSEDG